VYHVTNLTNDETPGSLVYGLKHVEGPRTIVFDVSGLIDMKFAAVFATPNVTLAAQTAPGKGICLMHSNVNFGSDNIVRFLRARRGLGTPDDTGNAMGVTGADNTIIDHVTASWGTDETFSSRGAHRITFQRSMIAEALGIAHHKNYPDGTNHGYAATIGGDIGSFHHNCWPTATDATGAWVADSPVTVIMPAGSTSSTMWLQLGLQNHRRRRTLRSTSWATITRRDRQ
jgi:hypothetical protein